MTEESRRALAVAERVALQAGELVMKGWRAVGEISRKGRFDLVTEFDLASEQLIRKELTQEFPTHRIIGEENAESGEGELVWYVDPIDGTTNFAHGHFSSVCRSRSTAGRRGSPASFMHRHSRHVEGFEGHGRVSQWGTLLGVDP